MKNKEKLILLLIIALFVMPSMVSNISADTVDRLDTFYFNGACEYFWYGNPGFMYDSYINNYAYSLGGGEELLCSNSYSPGPQYTGEIVKVELQVNAYCSHNLRYLILEPEVGFYHTEIRIPLGLESGEDAWSDLYEINFNPPINWDWDDISDLICMVIADPAGSSEIVTYCSYVKIYVSVDVTP